MKKSIIILLIIYIVLIGCNKDSGKEKENYNNSTKKIEYFMAGSVASEEKIDVSSKITSRVLKVNGEIGNTIKKGDNIISLEKKDITTQLESAGKNYENAKLDMERAETSFENGFISQQQKENAEYRYKQAQASFEQAKSQYENGTLISPIDGIITSVNINAGELAFPNMTLLTIININNIYINAYIPESMLYMVKPNMKVKVRILDNQFDGKISVIDPVIDPKSKNSLVKVKIDDFDPMIKPGMFVLIGIEKDRRVN